MVGLLAELGPSTIPNRDLKPVRNPHAWNNNASVIFLDQPVNTGFSYSSKTVDSTYAKQDFHIAGESYAGHYIPTFSQEILSHKDRNINLKSVLIGNGLTDPLTQYRYYKPMACGEGGYPAVLDEAGCRSLENALPRCQALIKECYDKNNTSQCASATRTCNAGLLSPYQRSGRDVYDVRKRADEEETDYSSQYLDQASVKEALGVEVETFDQCNGQINGEFVAAGDWMQPTFRAVPGLLEEIPVLIYAGDADYICNWLGNRAWTDALEWPGRDAFGKAKQVKLRSPAGKEDYGYIKTAQNFAFLQVREAGHMVPASQPEAAADFFNRWIRGEWFTKK